MLGRHRDPSAIEPLFRAHFDAVFRYAACRVGRDAALDVASETFAQALRSLNRLDPERDARAWLFGIATNVLRHHRRAEARRLRAYARAERQRGPHATDDSDGPSHDLASALRQLSSDDRNALLLYAWAGLSYDEVAGALEIPVGTVRSRIHRARLALRTVFGTADGDRPRTTEGDLTWTS